MIIRTEEVAAVDARHYVPKLHTLEDLNLHFAGTRVTIKWSYGTPGEIIGRAVEYSYLHEEWVKTFYPLATHYVALFDSEVRIYINVENEAQYFKLLSRRLRSQLANEEASHRARADAMQAEIARLKEQISKWRKAWQRGNGRIHELNAEVEQLNARTDAMHQAITYMERDNTILQQSLADAMRAVPESDAVLIGELIDIIRDFGHGDDTPEYKRALELIGAVPEGDMSAPTPGLDLSTECSMCKKTEADIMQTIRRFGDINVCFQCYEKSPDYMRHQFEKRREYLAESAAE
jgi:hypothetical protein